MYVSLSLPLSLLCACAWKPCALCAPPPLQEHDDHSSEIKSLQSELEDAQALCEEQDAQLDKMVCVL